MRANWYGIAGERVKRAFGRISASEVISGIPGSQQDHFGVPYALTEEFTIVYRMHPLIADDYSFRSAADGHELEQRTLRELSGPDSQPVLERIGMRDLLYSFGTANPGAIVLQQLPPLPAGVRAPRRQADGHRRHRHPALARARRATLQRVPAAAPPAPGARLRRTSPTIPRSRERMRAALRRRHRAAGRDRRHVRREAARRGSRSATRRFGSSS